MKSTPTRGVKQSLKPDAYKQSELDWTFMMTSIWDRLDPGWNTHMIENGVAAILFTLVALIDTYTSGVSPFALRPSDQTATLSLGPTFFNEDILGGEVRASYSPGFTLGILDPVLDLSVTDEGSVFVGAGLRWERDLFDWPAFVALEAIPGAYFVGGGEDLGSVFEVRSGIELGLIVNDQTRVSIITDHRSNAGIGDRNPGLESIAIRYQRRF